MKKYAWLTAAFVVALLVMAPGSRAAPFVNDTFTGAAGNLTAHTPETGGPWTAHPINTGTTQLTGSGKIRETTLGVGVYYAAGAPPSADQVISSTFIPQSSWSLDTWTNASLACRMSTTAYTGYFARYYKSSTITGRWEIAEYVNASAGAVGTIDAASSTYVLAASATYPVEFSCIGSALTLKRTDTGATLVSATDSTITAAGKTGIQISASRSAPCSPNCNTATDGIHMDSFTADTPAPPPPACPPGSSVVPTTYSTILAAYNATSAGGTVCVNGGSYSMANMTISKAITIMGVNTPSITQTSTSGNLFSVTAANVTMSGLTMTAQNRGYNNNDCGSPRTQLINVSAGSSNINNNILWSACGGITLSSVASGSVTYNTVNNMSYWGIDVDSGGGSVGAPIVIDHNTVNNVHTDVGAPLTDNAYGIVASGSPVPHDVDITYNAVNQAPTWECLDTHGGQRINFLHNSCVNAGRQPIVASGSTISRIEDNTVDAANRTSVWNAVINTGADVAGNSMLRNTVTHYPGTGENGACFYAPNFSGNPARYLDNNCSA